MEAPSSSELLETIKKIPKDKAAGYDGVDINIIKLLIEEPPNDNTFALV